MGGELRRSWREFKQAEPGRRFQQRYERNQHARKTRPWYGRFFKPVIGLFVIAVGIIFVIFPGPGIPFLIVGASLLADHSLTVARSLDWTEVKVRHIIDIARSWWKHASVAARSSVVLLSLLAASGAGYFVYRIAVS